MSQHSTVHNPKHSHGTCGLFMCQADLAARLSNEGPRRAF